MRIGIIGAGRMGASLGRVWARIGHELLLSYSRDPARLARMAEQLGGSARSGSPSDAARFGELVLLAVKWEQLEDAIGQARELQGKVVVSCVTPLLPDFSGLTIGHSTSAAERVAELAPGAGVVEAFNSVFADLIDPEDRPFDGARPTVFYCGDDADAKQLTRGLIDAADLEPIDAGSLRSARYIEPFGLLMTTLAYGQGLGPAIAVKLLQGTSPEQSVTGTGQAEPLVKEGQL